MKNKIILLIAVIGFIILLICASAFLKDYNKEISINLSGTDKVINNNEEMIKQNSEGQTKENEKEEERNMKVLQLTTENFEKEVLESEKTVLIDFYADWCAPCKMMAPIVEKLAEENEDIKVVKVNIDEEESLAVKYGIMSIPTFVVIKDGQEVKRTIGVVDKATLEEIIK